VSKTYDGKTLDEIAHLLVCDGRTALRAVPSMISDLRAQAERVTELETRLETNAVWQMIDGKMTRVAVEPGSIPDGIECRDETIKLQDKHIAELRERVRVLEEMLDHVIDMADHFSDRSDGTQSLELRTLWREARELVSGRAAEPEGGTNG
jgi:hypothetical protein